MCNLGWNCFCVCKYVRTTTLCQTDTLARVPSCDRNKHFMTEPALGWVGRPPKAPHHHSSIIIFVWLSRSIQLYLSRTYIHSLLHINIFSRILISSKFRNIDRNSKANWQRFNLAGQGISALFFPSQAFTHVLLSHRPIREWLNLQRILASLQNIT